MRPATLQENEPVLRRRAPYQPEEHALFTFEIVAVAYFVVLAVVSPLAGASARWIPVGAAALAAGGAVLAASRVLGPDLRVWLALLYLVAGYWLPAQLVTQSPAAFEAWLRRNEAFGSFGSFRWLREMLELAYLCCYPVVPAAFLAVYLNGSIGDVDRFWTAVLAAGYLCYFSLPWLVSRPPRLLEQAVVDDSRLRRLNLRVLDRFSHGWNTFPSGHVAVAFAAALSVMAVTAVLGTAFLIVAVGIAIGSVSGRYHYLVDSLTAVLVGLGVWALAATLVPG
jgi:PAP2 superfamily protein